MPRFRPPRPPAPRRVLNRHSETLAKAIARLEPGHRDLVQRIVTALDPAPPLPDDEPPPAAGSDRPGDPQEPH